MTRRERQVLKDSIAGLVQIIGRTAARVQRVEEGLGSRHVRRRRRAARAMMAVVRGRL